MGDSRIDQEFTALPLRELADAALSQASSLGAQHADFRAERIRGQQISLSDGTPQTLFDADDTGLAVRVIVDGTWGFASAVDLTADAAAQAAREAVEVARVAAAMNTEPIDLAPEPAYGDVTWVSDYDVDPFTVSVADKVERLAQWSRDLLAHSAVSHVDASLQQVRECKFYCDGATTATQQRVRLHPAVTAIAVTDDGRFDTMIDTDFTALPLRDLADAALSQARSLGAQHADFRAERIRGQQISLSDGNPQTLFDADDTGLAVRVIVDGTWGFASAVDLTADAAAQAARQAVEVARVAAAMNTEPIELAPEPAYGEVTWVSAYEVDPLTISAADKVALLAQWSRDLLAHPAVSHVDASLQQVRECKFYSDGATTAIQQRVRLHPVVTAIAVTDDGRFDTMRTLAPPAGRG